MSASQNPIIDRLTNIIDGINMLMRSHIKQKDLARLRKIRSIYHELLDKSIEKMIEENTPGFLNAVKELDEACKNVDDAIQNINMVSATIDKVVCAAKAVDTIFKLGINLIR